MVTASLYFSSQRPCTILQPNNGTVAHVFILVSLYQHITLLCTFWTIWYL